MLKAKAPAQPPIVRELKIKTGVLKRLKKELAAYEQEAVQQQERIDRLVAANADFYDIKKQREVLDETTQMLPDCKLRLDAARTDLERVLESFPSDVVAAEDVAAAKEALEAQ
ncbi:tubulin binding cofactor A [Zopfochytrium polystomum]|nr:tubulin binding cofactor A [Zopfochytrium polystomum]